MRKGTAIQYLICVAVLAGAVVTAQEQNSASPAAQGAQTPAMQPAATQSQPQGVKKEEVKQDAAKKDEEPAVVLKSTTRLVVIDVVASDNHGKPLTNLEAKDFTVLEDGKPQEIKIFSFQSPSESAPATATAQNLPKLPPDIFTNAVRSKPTRPLTILLLDALNTKTIDQSSAKDEMLKFVAKLPSDQPVAVYGLGSKLFLLQDITSDPTLLKEAVKKLSSKGSPVLEKPTGGTGMTEVLPGAMLELMPEQMQEQVKVFRQEAASMQTDIRVNLTLSALTALARTVAGYPGRKNLIWLSESFPLAILNNDVALKYNGIRSNQSNRDYSGDFDRAATILTDAQVAVYPVDIGNLVGNQVISGLSNTDSNGDYLGRTLTGRGSGTPLQRSLGNEKELNVTSEEQFSAHTTMNDLAERTGGKAFYNRNDVLNSINNSINDGSTYYTVGYYPDNKDWNGIFRKVQIKVDHPGAKLRYRQGYFAIDPFSYAKLDPNKRAVDFGAALSLDFPISTGLMFQARVNPPSAATGNKVVIQYAVDPHAVHFETQSDGLRHAAVDCGVEVYSRKGDRSLGVYGNTSSGKLKEEQFARIIKSFFPCQVQFDLAPGDYILRLGVRDGNTGLIGTTNAVVTIPATPAPSANSKPPGGGQ